MEQLITKITRHLKNSEGAEVKIVAERMGLAGTNGSTDICVFTRQDDSQPWRYCSDRPHPDWREMSVEDYKKKGRPEMLQVTTIGEILKTSSFLGRSLSCLDSAA